MHGQEMLVSFAAASAFWQEILPGCHLSFFSPMTVYGVLPGSRSMLLPTLIPA